MENYINQYIQEEDQSINIPEIKISYAVTVCNELEEIQRLIPHLLKHKRPQDEIVVLWDNNGDRKVWEYLVGCNYLPDGEEENFLLYEDKFQNHFADWKNKLTSFCEGNFIFQIDADEIPNEGLMRMIHWLIHSNKEVDVFLVPRENYVTGITQEHINKWGWKVDEKQRINWPDIQWRIYKNIPEIKWVNKVHERLDGFKNFAYLPTETEWSLNHTKDIKRQEKQNNYYNTL